ncbi:hypothetical protein TNCV_1500741 [Trichonephila clavipes]|nr:hypothetical protein TNCV_1500741 [Trichonephila clavipes]
MIWRRILCPGRVSGSNRGDITALRQQRLLLREREHQSMVSIIRFYRDHVQRFNHFTEFADTERSVDLVLDRSTLRNPGHAVTAAMSIIAASRRLRTSLRLGRKKTDLNICQ